MDSDLRSNAAGGPSAVALYRFVIVSHARARMLRGEPRSRAAAEVARCGHAWPDGRVGRRVSARTVLRWVVAFERGGLAALEPMPLPRRTRALSARLTTFLPSAAPLGRNQIRRHARGPRWL